jgi:hypothetical protein
MIKAYLATAAGTALRHGTSALGVWLVAEGYADADTAQALAGGVLTAGMAAISIVRTKVKLF